MDNRASSGPHPGGRHRHHVHHGKATTIATELSYKSLKEAWIADQTGSSVHRVNILGLVMLSTYALWAVLKAKRLRYNSIHRQHSGSSSAITLLDRVPNWQLEYAVLIVPAIAAQTVLSSYLLALNAVIITLVVAVVKLSPLPQRLQNTTSSMSRKGQGRHWSSKYIDESQEQTKPLLETETDMPFRVSIDSAAEAAHAAAAPPTYYTDSENDTDISRDAATVASDHDPVNARRPSLLDTSHSRNTSDGLSVISSSSPMSPLARSVVDPWAKAKQRSCVEPQPPSITAITQSASQSPPSPSLNKVDHAVFVRPQPFLTVYRAHMMLVTIIAILAVDFPVFPREFSKCETWGSSWMDMGVGSFVFSLGIISALPFLRSPVNRFTPLKRQLLSDAKKCLPLVMLGSVRVIMVKGVEYPEHVTEYGVHWNFFITLALLPFAATLSRPFSKYVRYSLLGLALSAVHQVLLTHTSWQDWAISTAPRTSLAAQNKEGLTSLPGYLAIFYLGLDLGHYVLPLDPYFAYRKMRKTRLRPKTDKLAMVLASLSTLWWAAYGCSRLLGLQTSRRLANLPYVLWVTAFNTSFLLCYVLIYLYILQPVESTASQDETGVDKTKGAAALVTPKILSDLNRHSLTVFLIANLLTGLVNVTIQTMYTSDWLAFLILVLYTGICSAAAAFLTSIRFRLRL